MGTVLARALRTAGVAISGIAASSVTSGTQAARELDLRAFDNAGDLIGSPDVHICTPTNTHVNLALGVLHAVKDTPIGGALV
jgi:predicted dehydrogenase